MEFLNNSLFVFFIIILFVVLKGIKMASEFERFAIIDLGKFKKLKGPGLLIKLWGQEVEWVKLRMGDRGELVSNEIGRFYDKDIPVQINSKLPIGTMIRISGFENDRLVVEKDPSQQKSYICKKCGHENII